jgi:hypothetical protein
VRGGKIFPVADLLLAKDIPFALASGYADSALPEGLRGQHRLTKPFSEAELDKMIERLCSLSAETGPLSAPDEISAAQHCRPSEAAMGGRFRQPPSTALK